MEDQNTVVATYDGMNIEELIGFVEEEYPCVYCQVNGTLYAGTDGIAFLGKFYLFNKKIHLKWVDVKVQQTDQGISIQTRDDAMLHEFSGIHKPERVWSALMSLHNQAILDRTKFPSAAFGVNDNDGGDGTATGDAEGGKTRGRSATTQPIHRRKQLRRMTSDPNKLIPNIDALFAVENRENQLEGEALLGVSGGDNDPVNEATSLIPQQKAESVRKMAKRSSVIINQEHQLSTRAAESLGAVDVNINPMAHIEAIVGKIQGAFVCLYNGQKGTLYAGSTALHFSGERLFFAARLTVQSRHIRQVKMIKGKPRSDGNADGVPQLQQEALDVEHAIQEQGIEICSLEGISHNFLGMENPDQVWACLVSLRKHASSGPYSPRPFAMRRMNSDPNLTSHTTGLDMMPQAQNDDKERALKESALPVLSDEELIKAWSGVIDKKNRYKTCVAKDHELSCSLDTFFNSYISDNAQFSIPNYMEAEGDKELQASSWKVENADGKLTRSRVVRYIHLINAPLAPPEAKARKEQTYHRYGDLGIVMETKTLVDGVPLTDCFFVKDRLIITPQEGTGHVLLTMEFELEFVKSTMFRGVITKTTTSEMSKFFQNMRDYMARSVGEEVNTTAAKSKPKAIEKVDQEVVKEETSSLPFGIRPASLTPILLGGVIFLQFLIMLEMHSMKRSIGRIEAR